MNTARVESISTEELRAFDNFAEGTHALFMMAFAHAEKQDRERYLAIMRAVDEKRAVPRIVTEWEARHLVVTVTVEGKDSEGNELSVIVFRCRMRLKVPAGAH